MTTTTPPGPSPAGQPPTAAVAGQTCPLCQTPILDGERVRPLHVASSAIGRTVVAVHVACGMLGTVGHLYGVCSCTGYATSGPDSRPAAIELWRRVISGTDPGRPA